MLDLILVVRLVSLASGFLALGFLALGFHNKDKVASVKPELFGVASLDLASLDLGFLDLGFLDLGFLDLGFLESDNREWGVLASTDLIRLRERMVSRLILQDAAHLTRLLRTTTGTTRTIETEKLGPSDIDSRSGFRQKSLGAGNSGESHYGDHSWLIWRY